MLINQSDNGFSIHIRTMPADTSSAPVDENIKIVSVGALGDRIKEFIASAMLKRQGIQVVVSLEKWDSTCVLEETVYRVMPMRAADQHSDFSRNYWIETKIK